VTSPATANKPSPALRVAPWPMALSFHLEAIATFNNMSRILVYHNMTTAIYSSFAQTLPARGFGYVACKPANNDAFLQPCTYACKAALLIL
jgi:hypothetical protein